MKFEANFFIGIIAVGHGVVEGTTNHSDVFEASFIASDYLVIRNRKKTWKFVFHSTNDLQDAVLLYDVAAVLQ